MDEGIFFFKRGGKNWYENFSQCAWGTCSEYGWCTGFAAVDLSVSLLTLTGVAGSEICGYVQDIDGSHGHVRLLWWSLRLCLGLEPWMWWGLSKVD